MEEIIKMEAEEELYDLSSTLRIYLLGGTSREVMRLNAELTSSFANFKDDKGTMLKVSEPSKLSAEEGETALFMWGTLVTVDGSLSIEQIKKTTGRERGNAGQNQDAAFFNGGQGGRGPGGRDGGQSAGHGVTGRGNGDGQDCRPPAQGAPRERDVNGRPEKWCRVCGYWTGGANYSHTSEICPYRQQQSEAVNVAAEVNQKSEVNNSTSGNDNPADQQEGQRVHIAGVPALHFT